MDHGVFTDTVQLIALTTSASLPPYSCYRPIFLENPRPVVYCNVIGALPLCIARGWMFWLLQISYVPSCPAYGRSMHVWAQPDQNSKTLQILTCGPLKGPENVPVRGLG